MHERIDSLEIEPGFLLPVFDATYLAHNKAQLSKQRQPLADTLLRYCRYSSRTFQFLGLEQRQRISNQIFEKVATHVDAVVTPYTLGVVERKSVTTSTVDSKVMPLPGDLNDYILVQEVDIIQPSMNIARRLKSRSKLKSKLDAINRFEMIVDGFQWTDGSSSQYVFGTTAAERQESHPPKLHQVDMEFYIDPTLHFLAETGLIKEW